MILTVPGVGLGAIRERSAGVDSDLILCEISAGISVARYRTKLMEQQFNAELSSAFADSRR